MKILVTGGAGFIGSHVAETYARQGHYVLVVDNLSRAQLLGRQDPHSHYTWSYLKSISNVRLVNGSVLDRALVEELVHEADAVVHAAGQTAVTASVAEPTTDFETNAIGTFRILEALRTASRCIPVVVMSTNKVYGDNVNKIPTRERATRYEFGDGFEHGISEALSVDGCAHTPYGVSKLSADLYAQEFARIYGLPTAVFRMSCVYGPRQFGVEDQGWVAHFVISVLTGAPITVYGDGKQVRDVLFVDDLVRAVQDFIVRASEFPEGLLCNVGGGTEFTLSLVELLDFLNRETGRRSPIRFAPWRPSDQRVYVSDIRRIASLLGWHPRVPPEAGVHATIRWVADHIALFQREDGR